MANTNFLREIILNIAERSVSHSTKDTLHNRLPLFLDCLVECYAALPIKERLHIPVVPDVVNLGQLIPAQVAEEGLALACGGSARHKIASINFFNPYLARRANLALIILEVGFRHLFRIRLIGLYLGAFLPFVGRHPALYAEAHLAVWAHRKRSASVNIGHGGAFGVRAVYYDLLSFFVLHSFNNLIRVHSEYLGLQVLF